jgi:hypothetical protein
MCADLPNFNRPFIEQVDQRRVFWSIEAPADVRAIDRETALRLLKSLDRFMKRALEREDILASLDYAARLPDHPVLVST